MANTIVTPKTFTTYSLGCRTNQAEMETIGKELMDHGLQPVENGSPSDLVLLNTCVVTQKAEKETRQKIRELRKKFPKAFLTVIGCAVTAKEKFFIDLPEADLVIPNEDKSRTVNLLEQKLGPFNKVSVFPIIDNAYIRSGRKFIKIQDGCDLYCSFCLTAYLRGLLKSVLPDKLIEEINFWVVRGVKEIILTGINIALYGKDLNGITLIDLINLISNKTKVERITLSSIYPEMLSSEFLELIIKNQRITRSLHLSLQSGSPAVLKRMNRNIDINKLTDSLLFIKNKIPKFTFRADLITGFPGETDEEFQETLEFIRCVKISFTHVFPFSARKGTKAYEMIKEKKWRDLPANIKKERVKEIMATIKNIHNDEAKQMINKKFHCLMVRQKGSQWEGITENGWIINIKYQISNIKNIKGKIVPVKIIDFKEDQLLGEILSLPI